MAQYKTGNITTTNGSQIVTGSGTLWLANISPGDGFTVAGTGVPYEVASVDSDTQITLNANYAGSSGSGLSYTIWRDFEVNTGAPEMSQGDIETATIFTRAVRALGQRLGLASTATAGIVEKATPTEALNGTADKYPDAAGVHAAFKQYGYFNDVNTGIRFLSDNGGDANTLALNSGRYLGQSTKDLNLPSGATNGVLERKWVSSSSSGYGVDTYENYTDGNTWYRYIENGAFSSWYRVYNQSSILGTVSQSGGVPTGAVIEAGSNANGEYTKFADGTMICAFDSGVNSPTGTAFGSIYISARITFTFPSAFVSPPKVAPISRFDSASGGSLTWGLLRLRTSTTVEIYGASGVSIGTAYLAYVATGRWF